MISDMKETGELKRQEMEKGKEAAEHPLRRREDCGAAP